jgi:hypothetical protein
MFNIQYSNQLPGWQASQLSATAIIVKVFFACSVVNKIVQGSNFWHELGLSEYKLASMSAC